MDRSVTGARRVVPRLDVAVVLGVTVRRVRAVAGDLVRILTLPDRVVERMRPDRAWRIGASVDAAGIREIEGAPADKN